MQIRAGYQIALRCEQQVPLIGMLNVHRSRAGDLLSTDAVLSDPPVRAHMFEDAFGNTCTRMLVPNGVLTLRADFTIRDSGAVDAAPQDADDMSIDDLPDEVLQYLLASRYCETDKLSPLAWSLFGDAPAGAARVAAIVRYVHDHIAFGYEHASSTRSAWDVQHERVGVCRDFVHLAVAFCRALNIPARYCTGFLPDIGVEPSDVPMDFTAWMEAYVGGRWYTFDPRHATPRIGRILMARGRDASDVAIYTTFGPSELVSFRVFAEEC